jgi:hypothetical protein
VDIYDVQGAGTSVQCEPRGVADSARGLSGYTNDYGVPNYDAVIWLQGTFDAHSYADTTRLELANYLDQGGNLFSTGDQVAFHLGAGGNDADSGIGFLARYLGISFPVPEDEATDVRVLYAEGEPGSAYEGVLLSLYGECPVRRKFDRLTLATPDVLSENAVLMRYAGGWVTDNGRPAIVLNERFGDSEHTNPTGKAIHVAFGISAMYGRYEIAILLDNALHDVFGLTDPHWPPPLDVPDPTHGPRYDFQLGRASPNPFRQETSIRFNIARRAHVSIAVYNVLGQRVRVLVDEVLEPNSYVRAWNGRSDEGSEVSSGIYFYELVAGDFSDTKKAVVLR